MSRKKDREQLERIRDVLWGIPINSSTKLLTGKNSSGKSLIRDQLRVRVKKKLGGTVVHASQELRTGSNPEMGALSSMARDLPWLPTSLTTIHHIQMSCRSARDGKHMFVIDEPEIGCGEETVVALCKWLNEEILTQKFAGGLLIITHNRYMVENLNCKHFFNLDGYKTKEEWLNRKIRPTNLKELEENRLFKLIRDGK